MSEPCKNCERCGSAECLERVGSMRPQETLAWMAHYLTCAQRTYARALAAEKQLATLQQTVDAIVKERDALRGKVARVRKLLSENGCDCQCDHDHGDHDNDCDECFACRVSLAILNDKETAK